MIEQSNKIADSFTWPGCQVLLDCQKKFQQLWPSYGIVSHMDSMIYQAIKYSTDMFGWVSV